MEHENIFFSRQAVPKLDFADTPLEGVFQTAGNVFNLSKYKATYLSDALRIVYLYKVKFESVYILRHNC